MTEFEMLQTICTDIREMKQDMSNMKTDVSELKTDVSELKTDVSELKTDVSELKTDVSELETKVSALETKTTVLQKDVNDIQLTLEYETNRNIRIIAEGHLDLYRRFMDALQVETEKETLLIRVSVLENEVRRLNSRMASIA